MISRSFVKRIVISACAPMALLAFVPADAVAQSVNSGDDALEEIVVSGYRASVARALDRKRDAVGSRDSILAEDAAKFPDTNLAESIQRVPGIAITRDAGEGRQVSLRGLGPDFTRVRLNGMETLGTTMSIDSRGGTNRSRAFDFNLFASELFNRIDVVKSSSASMEEGGIAGTVDLRTARPFDFKDFTVTASAQGAYNTNAGKVDPRGAVLISDTFANGKAGALFSAAYSKRQVVEQGYSTVRWGSGNWTLANVDPGVDPAIVARLNSSGADKLFYPRFARYDQFLHDQDRLGMTVALQGRPTDWLDLDADILYGQLKNERREHHLDSSSFSRTGADGIRETIVKSLVVQGNDIVAGSFENVDHRMDGRLDHDSTDFYMGSLSATARPNEQSAIVAYLGYQRSEFDNKQQSLYFRSQNKAFSWDFRENDRVPLQTYGIDLTKPDDWNFDFLRLRSAAVDNEIINGRLDGSYEIGDVTLRTGYDWKQFTYTSGGTQSDFTAGLRGRTVSDLYRLLPHTYGKGLDAPAGVPKTWIVPNLDRGFDVLNADSYSAAYDPGADNEVEELTNGGYVQADWDASLFGRALRGNAGVRFVRTDLTSTGAVSTGSGVNTVEMKRHYTDWLPSISLVYEPVDDLLVRLNANKNLTRPTLASLTPGGSVNSSGRSVSVGNPELEPFRANSLDGSIEYYMGNEGLIAVAPFYKDIKSFIVSQVRTQVYRDSGWPLELVNANISNVDDVFTFTQPVNGRGAKIKGVELIYQQPFTFLPDPLDGFGMIVNYTYADSKANYEIAPGVVRKYQLTGLSKNSANFTLYYERETFGGRVSLNYRDGYLTDVPAGNGNDVAGYHGATNVDFSLFYNINENTKVTFEGVNMTNAAEDQYVDSSDRVYNYTRSGRQFLLGLRWSL